MSDRLTCLPRPLAFLCALDDWRHERHDDTAHPERRSLICVLHDGTFALCARFRWWFS